MLTFIFGRVNGTITLIALALGYVVCCLARKEEGILKKVGYIIGISIVVTSGVLIMGKLIWIAKMWANPGNIANFPIPSQLLQR